MAKASPDDERKAKALALFNGHESHLAGRPGGKRLIAKDFDFTKLDFFRSEEHTSELQSH